jgi:CspA family cold shock protein
VADASLAGDLPAGISRAYLQGVVKSYDPLSGDGSVLCDADLAEYELSREALDGSIFRMLRQGQRVVFDLDEGAMATRLRMGSEADMATPGFPAAHPGDDQHPQGGADLADA